MNGKQGSLYANHEALKFALSATVDTIGLWAKVILTMVIPIIIRISGIFMLIGASGFSLLNMASDMPFVDYLNPMLAKLSLRMFIIAVLAYIFFELFWSILQLGAAQIALDIHDRNSSSWGRLFCCVRLMFYQMIAALIYFIAALVGLVLFVVPGIIVLVRLWPFRFVMVERQCGPIEALRISAMLTKGHTRRLIEMLFLLIVVATLPFSGMALTSNGKFIGWQTGGLALFIIYPMAELLLAFVYRRLALREKSVFQSVDRQIQQ